MVVARRPISRMRLHRRRAACGWQVGSRAPPEIWACPGPAAAGEGDARGHRPSIDFGSRPLTDRLKLRRQRDAGARSGHVQGLTGRIVAGLRRRSFRIDREPPCRWLPERFLPCTGQGRRRPARRGVAAAPRAVLLTYRAEGHSGARVPASEGSSGPSRDAVGVLDAPSAQRGAKRRLGRWVYGREGHASAAAQPARCEDGTSLPDLALCDRLRSRAFSADHAKYLVGRLVPWARPQPAKVDQRLDLRAPVEATQSP